MKKLKIAVLGFVILTLLLVSFFLGRTTKKNHLRNEFDDLIEKYNKLESFNYLREESDVRYYGLEKDSVLRMLPPAKWETDTIKLFDSGQLESMHWSWNYYKERLKNSRDTVTLQEYYWELPEFVDLQNLYIIFELQSDSSWIAKSCVQWNPNTTEID